MNLQKNSHCSYCGTYFDAQITWPRTCKTCLTDSFSNPLPVVVVLLSVKERGLLIQKRGIEPQKGGWALTGGYIDDRETWQHAAVREVREELGLETKEKDYKLWDVTSSTNKENILIFCTYEHTLNSIEGLNFKTNNEVEAVDVMWEPMTLAFPAHTEHANKYLVKLNEE